MKRTIVIADDNPAFINSIIDFFERTNDYEIVGTAGDGLEASAIIEKHSP
ncbi:MAG: sporulation transcription factor Spo0A, partial [Clostridiales bacterium]|nr:sporulation transcription factor Spo0A [Clostridiales bacterium]